MGAVSVSSPNEQPVLSLDGTLGTEFVSVTTKDSDVIAAISRFERPDVGIVALLSIGARATLAVSTGFDVQAVEHELNAAVDSVTGELLRCQREMLQSVAEDGALATILAEARQELARLLHEALSSQANPDATGSFMAKLHAVTKRVDERLDDTRKEIVDQMTKTMAAHAEGIRRAAQDVRDLDPSSGLGQAVTTLQRMMADVQAAVTANKATAAERRKSAAKGRDYESLVAELVGEIAAGCGDRAEHTGDLQGEAVLKRGRAKRGDIVCDCSPGGRIAIEAMARESSPQTAAAITKELGEAMKNRQAQAAIAVLAVQEARVMCGQQVQLLGPNMAAVVVDPEEADATLLRLIYLFLRRSVGTATSDVRAIDLDSLMARTREIERKLGRLKAVRTQLDNILSGQVNASRELTLFESELATAVAQLIASLEAEVGEMEAA